jgi:DNA topoisomerase-2
VKILGLQFEREYSDLSSLRYGGLMIMSDQDHDGSHIKGLIINFIQFFWPSLVKINRFIKAFITPIIKVARAGETPISFFSQHDFEKWRSDTVDAHRYHVSLQLSLGQILQGTWNFHRQRSEGLFQRFAEAYHQIQV